jgi:hypothetical protein
MLSLIKMTGISLRSVMSDKATVESDIFKDLLVVNPVIRIQSHKTDSLKPATRALRMQVIRGPMRKCPIENHHKKTVKAIVNVDREAPHANPSSSASVQI